MMRTTLLTAALILATIPLRVALPDESTGQKLKANLKPLNWLLGGYDHKEVGSNNWRVIDFNGRSIEDGTALRITYRLVCTRDFREAPKMSVTETIRSTEEEGVFRCEYKIHDSTNLALGYTADTVEGTGKYVVRTKPDEPDLYIAEGEFTQKSGNTKKIRFRLQRDATGAFTYRDAFIKVSRFSDAYHLQPSR